MMIQLDTKRCNGRHSPLTILCDDKGQVIQCNQRAKDIGVKPDVLMQDYLADVLSQRTWMQMLAEAAMKDNPQSDRSFCLLAKFNQEMFSFECFIEDNIVEGSKQKEIYLIGVLLHKAFHAGVNPHDTLERKYVYDMSLLDSRENAVIATDTNGRIIYYNDAAEKLYEQKAEDVLGKRILDVTCAEEMLDEGHSVMRDLVQGNSWSGSWMCKRKDGITIRVSCTDYPIFDPAGKLIGIVGVSCLETESENLRKQTRLDKSLNCSNIPALLTQLNFNDAEAEVLWANEALVNLLGNGVKILGLKVRNFLKVPCPFSLHGQLVDMNSGNDTFEVECLQLPHIQMTLLLFRDAYIRRKLEVSLKSAAENAETRAFKTDFITTMSHELRTPLHALGAEVEHLELYVTELEEKMTLHPLIAKNLLDSFSAIRYSYNLLYLLIKNVLNWQKFSSGKWDTIREAFDLRETLNEIIRNIRYLTNLRHLKLETIVDQAIPETILTDSLKVTQILINFISNAIKYTHEYTTITIRCRIKVETNECQERRSYVVIDVEDQGPGIPSNLSHLLFQRFAQLRQSSDEKGIGLGLSISKQLAELLSGEVGYRPSSSGQGSCFWVSFPFDPIDDSLSVLRNTDDKDLDFKAIAEGPSSISSLGMNKSNNRNYNVLKRPHTDSQQDFGGRKRSNFMLSENNTTMSNWLLSEENILRLCPVLVVDDNPVNLKLMERMLTSLGFNTSNIDFSIDGLDAVDKANQKLYKLILMDISMPKMNGVEATRCIRQRGFENKAREIVGVTANALEEHRESCLESGMDEFLVKPLSVETLMKILQNLARI